VTAALDDHGRDMSPASSALIRDARSGDAPRIAEVARASWADTYRDIFTPAFVDDFLARNYSVPALETAILRTGERVQTHFLVAERGGQIVGYLQFGEGSRGPELFRIYADPAHYGTGVGSAMLDELHRRVEGKVDSYVLDVHSRNERGRAFYDRKGFVIVGGGATPDCDLMLRRTLRPRQAPLPIDTDRLRLRAVSDDDAAALHRIYGDAETMRYVGRHGRPTASVDQTRQSLAYFVRHQALHGFSLWAVDERRGEAFVGLAGLVWVEGHGPDVEVAYVVRRDRWGRGYATEATRAILDVAHGPLGLAHVVALAWPENDASRRVMEKAGMTPDGTATAYGREMTRHVRRVT
jgi:[ribosomal protein S5]-alanine N-acetyltransferase